MYHLVIAALFGGFLLSNGAESSALTRDENLDALVPNIKSPRGALPKMRYLDSRVIEGMTVDVPQLMNANGNDKNLLDISTESDLTNSEDLYWSAWSEWTDCSRSCGGGVYSRERKCLSRSDNLVDLQCQGKSIQHELCNKQACLVGTPDFREMQCSQRNDELFFSNTFEWVPYTGKDGSTCELFCQAKEFHFYNSFGTAVDGTRCGSARNGICVKGECIQTGCDGTIGSGITEDACGVCGGNNRTCIRYQSLVDHLPEGGVDSGYNEILEIPAGATTIRIRDYNSNYLAIAEVEGGHETYIINGGWVVCQPGEFKTAGTVAIYDRDNDSDNIIIAGPTTKPLRIMVLSLGEAPLVQYEYRLPKSSEEGNAALGEPPSTIIHIPDEDDLRNQILSAGLDFDALVPPSSVPATTTSTTTTDATTEVIATKPQTGISRQGQCKSCRKIGNKKKQFCDSDYVIHVRILGKRTLHRGRFVRYEVEVLNNYKSNVRMLRREYVWISSTCCPRLHQNGHYLLMGRTVKVEATKSVDSIDLSPGKPAQYETKLVVEQAEAWYAWRKYQVKMARAAKRINCKRYRYLAAKFYRRKQTDI